MNFLKDNNAIVITAIVSFLLGIINGSSGITYEQFDFVNKQLNSVKKELDQSKNTIKKLEDTIIEFKNIYGISH